MDAIETFKNTNAEGKLDMFEEAYEGWIKSNAALIARDEEIAGLQRQLEAETERANENDRLCREAWVSIAKLGKALEQVKGIPEAQEQIEQMKHLLILALKYLEHPDVLEITTNMAAPGEILNEKIKACLSIE